MDRPAGIPATRKQRDGKRAPFVQAWPYLPEGGGQPSGYVARYQNGAGKEIIPFFKPGCKAGTFATGAADTPRPLFGLDTLARSGFIFISEGEKDAAALQMLGFCALTSAGGCEATDKADWGPVLRTCAGGRRPVVIWPDLDEPGQRYAVRVASQIGEGCLCLHPPAGRNATDQRRRRSRLAPGRACPPR